MRCSSAHSQRVILLLRALKTFLRAFSEKMPSGTNFRSRDEAFRGRSHMCMNLFRNACIALFAQCFGETIGYRSATFDTSFYFYAALCWGICRTECHLRASGGARTRRLRASGATMDCWTGAMFRKGFRLSLPEQPCCREAMLP